MNARRAMTLLEVIVALTIAGAALVAGASVLGFLTDQQNRSGSQAVASANAVRTALRDWASEAQLTTEGDAAFRGITSTRLLHRDDGMDDELTFVTSAPTQIGATGTIVHLHMVRGSDSLRGLVAELRPWRHAGPALFVSLAPDATGFQARYLGSIYGRRAWDRTWVSTSVLPAAVELRVLFDNTPTDRAAHALLNIPMTIALMRRQ